VGIWFLTRSSVAGQESHKTFRAPPANQLQGVADTATSWFAPLGAPALFRWTVFVVVAASLGLVVFQLVTRRWSVFPFGPVLLVIGVYTVVLLVSASYFGEISLGGRLLAPVQPLVVVLVAMALAALVAEYSPVVPAVRWMVVAPVSLVVLIGWFAPPVTLTIPVDLSTTPVSIAEAVERVPEGTAIYTTDPELVWSLTGRTSYALPSRLNQESSTPNEQFGTWVGQVAGQVAEGRAAVLYLDGAALLAPNLSNLPELNRASPRPLTTDALPGGVNLLRRA
jgi:hypothetical protein